MSGRAFARDHTSGPSRSRNRPEPSRSMAGGRRVGQAKLHPEATQKLPVIAFIYLATILLPLTLQVGPLALSSLRVLCLCVTLPLLIGVLRGRYGRVIWADWLALLHVSWAGISLLATDGLGSIELAGSQGVEFLGGYLIARTSVRNLAQFQALCRLLVGSLLILAPFALVEAIGGTSYILQVLQKVPLFKTMPVVNTDMRMGLHRVQSVFAHPIHFGLYASVCFALGWTALSPVMGTAQRLLIASLIGATGMLSLSSGGILAILLQIGLILWATVLPARLPRWWILVGLFVLAYIGIDLLSNRTPIRVFMSYATFSAHTASWRLLILEYGMANVWANPVFGLGTADWVRPAWMHTPSVDNFWLLNAMRHGILGFVTVAAVWAAVLTPAIRRPFASDSPIGQARLAWVFTIVGLCFTLITVHVWGNSYSFVMFLLGAGAWFGTADEEAPAPNEVASEPHHASRYTRFAAPEVRA